MNVSRFLSVMLLLAAVVLLFAKRDYLYKPAGITSPTNTDVWTAGKEYTLKWNGGSKDPTVAVFLIKKDLESQGVSVSIVDRIYNIKNNGVHLYKLPSNLQPGKYKLQIGALNSEYFEVLGSSLNTDTCKIGDLISKVSFEGAAGSVYATFEIENISTNKCIITGENAVQLHYNSTVNNIKVNFDENTVTKTYTLDKNASITAAARIQNGPQCSSKIVPTKLNYIYTANGQILTFSDSSGKQEFLINRCGSDKEITQVTMSSLKN